MKSKTTTTTNKERWHYTAPYILNPQHPVTINVIGAGGSGSRMLTELARMDHALKMLGHTGLFVTCFDDDIITEANLGRQLYSADDLGLNKATVLITRINQFMGTSWISVPGKFERGSITKDQMANITISCVDSVAGRRGIRDLLNGFNKWPDPYNRAYYWMDLGNAQNIGQFVIGTLPVNTGFGTTHFEQPKDSDTLEAVAQLPTVFERLPEIEHQKEKDQGPSCSVAEALDKQDLFINSTLVNLAAATLWKMFRHGKINYHGAFLNLQTMDIAKIKI